MKSRLFHIITLFALIGSTFLAPAGMAVAATEWTCSGVTLVSGGGLNKNVTVTLSHSTADNEKIDLNWGDGSPLLIIHVANTTTYLSNTQSHNYGNAAGTYHITMRVFGANQPGDGSHDCGTSVTFNGCAPSGVNACKLSPMDSGRNITATVTYTATGGNTASLTWGDGVTTTLPTGGHTNLTSVHHYGGTGTLFAVQLVIRNSSGTVIGTCTLTTTNTASDVTLSSMTAAAADSGINWTAMAFALLGLVVLGQVALFAILKRR